MKEQTTKDKILDTSIDLFAKYGYAQTSIRQIAETVGIKSSSIYNHFSSKEKIMEEILSLYKDIVFTNVLPEREVWSKKDKFTAKEICDILFFSFSVEDYNRYINIMKVIYTEHTHYNDIREFLLNRTIFDAFDDLKSELDYLIETKKINDCDTVSLTGVIVAVSLAYTILSTMEEMYIHREYADKTNMFAALEYVIRLATEAS